MTREEADKILDNIDIIESTEVGYKCIDVDDLIDKIYDDFEEDKCITCLYKPFSGQACWMSCVMPV